MAESTEGLKDLGPTPGGLEGLRICCAGPMLGHLPGRVLMAEQHLAERLAGEGADVRITSTQPGRVARLADTVSCLIRWRRQIDVVVLSVYSGRAFVIADVASATCQRLGLPVVMFLRGGDLPRFAERHPSWVSRVLRRAHTLVAPSEYLRHELGGLSLPVEVMPNFLDLDAYSYRPRGQIRPRLLWMRTFHPSYNPEMAVDALSVLTRARGDVQLTMAGWDAGAEPALRRYVREMGLEDRVRFVGFLDHEGKRRAFEDHDVYLHTNRIDNMPVSVVEALASGVPVVATRVGGIPYLLEDRKNAILVSSEDAEAMAEAVHELLGDPDLASRLASEGRELAVRFTWESLRPAWSGLITTVVRDAGTLSGGSVRR